MRKLRLGTNEDGSPLYHYEADPGEAVVFTGPISGTVDLPDGSTVDVSDAFIGVADEATALAVSDAIGERHVAEGHPAFVDEPHDFVHIPSSEG